VPRLGVIVGLASEADCFDMYDFDERPAIRVAGADARRAAEAAQALVSHGCSALISLGFSGALDPHHGPGDIIIADAVVFPDGRKIPTHARWRRGLELALTGHAASTVGTITGSDKPLLTPADKISCHLSCNALAVDMESHAVARVAERHGVPFAALRVISDSHQARIPAWTLTGIRYDGSIRKGQIAAGFLVQPWLWPTMMSLALSNRQAVRALRRAVLIAGPGLQFPG
jgi:adenosylhomocysteine nucleosidase